MLAEARSVVSTLREQLEPTFAGPLLVTGMLAEQLARELAQGASPGAVIADDASRLSRSAVVVHVIAGEPSFADRELVSEADDHGVPVVLVQLWPQEDWTPPFVLTPFVVECRAGQGFPIPEISRRIVEAVENPVSLARRVPVLEGPVGDSVVGATAIRAAILGVMGARSGARSQAARPLITLEQLRMIADLRMLRDVPAGSDALKSLGGIAVGLVGAGFFFRGAARNARRVFPAPLVNAGVAAAGTWAAGEAFRRLEARRT